jgi:hypothetical protein
MEAPSGYLSVEAFSTRAYAIEGMPRGTPSSISIFADEDPPSSMTSEASVVRDNMLESPSSSMTASAPFGDWRSWSSDAADMEEMDTARDSGELEAFRAAADEDHEEMSETASDYEEREALRDAANEDLEEISETAGDFEELEALRDAACEDHEEMLETAGDFEEREALRDELWDIFAPIFEILSLKESSIVRYSMLLKRYKLWCGEVLHGLSLAARDRYDQEGTLLLARIVDADVWTSFKSRDNASEWRLTSGYSERLVSSEGGEFNYYFVCLAKDTCWTMINSKKWIRHLYDPIANGECWYCNVCGTRYMKRFGVLVEYIRPHHAPRYMMAEYPPSSIRDVRATALEGEYENATTPAALFAAVPNLIPASNVHLRMIEPGIYSVIAKEKLLDRGLFSWERLFNLSHQGHKFAFRSFGPDVSLEWVSTPTPEDE